MHGIGPDQQRHPDPQSLPDDLAHLVDPPLRVLARRSRRDVPQDTFRVGQDAHRGA